MKVIQVNDTYCQNPTYYNEDGTRYYPEQLDITHAFIQEQVRAMEKVWLAMGEEQAVKIYCGLTGGMSREGKALLAVAKAQYVPF